MADSNDTGTYRTLSDVIAHIPDELAIDAVSIWHIVPIGQGSFGLSGSELVSFMRRAIIALLDAGAVPVRAVPDSGYEWVRQKQYGEERDQIAEAVLDEWKTVPDNTIAQITQCPWFARPVAENPHYVKMD